MKKAAKKSKKVAPKKKSPLLPPKAVGAVPAISRSGSLSPDTITAILQSKGLHGPDITNLLQ